MAANKQQVDDAIGQLRLREQEHLDVANKMLRADGGNLFCMDLFAVAVLNRSLRLIRGFADQVSTNFLCAAPLVRLQLDNFLRFGASFHVPDVNEFVLSIMRGTPVRKLKDKSGTLMTDAHLVDVFAEIKPGIRDIYERGCSYVHLCETHFFHAMRPGGESEERAIRLTVSKEDDEITDDHRYNATSTMTWVTDQLMEYVDGWVATKADPDLVTDPMKRAEKLIEQGRFRLAEDWLKQVIESHPKPEVVAAAKERLASIRS